MSDWDNDDPLGYARPPKWTRFKKGKSGNPRGRPKKKKKEQPEASVLGQQHAVLREEIDRKVKVTENGEEREITILEAVTKAQLANAIKGSPLAQRESVGRIERLEQAETRAAQESEEAKRAEEAAEKNRDELFFDYLVQLKKRQAKAWAEAERAGKEEPDFPWPHPDDIMLDEGRKKYRLRGPFDAEEVPLYKFMRSERDVALARMSRILWFETKAQRALAKAWGIFVRSYDLQLPLRWQIGTDWAAAIDHLAEMTLRMLDREIERLSQEANMHRRLAGVEDTPESYKIANATIWPPLQRGGYHSLAQFQEAYDATNGEPPWPRKRNWPNIIG